MSDETPDLRHLSEEEWLDRWRETLTVLELTRASVLDSEMRMTVVQAAMLDGQAEMLRKVLGSRGVDLQD